MQVLKYDIPCKKENEDKIVNQILKKNHYFFHFLTIVCTSFHEIKMHILLVPQQASI